MWTKPKRVDLYGNVTLSLENDLDCNLKVKNYKPFRLLQQFDMRMWILKRRHIRVPCIQPRLCFLSTPSPIKTVFNVPVRAKTGRSLFNI